MISDRKDRVSNKFYSWIFMIAGLRFPPIYDMKVAILQQKNKFGYLYKFNSERMANTGVMLPVDESGNPDYTFMEQYVKRVKETIKLQYLQGKMAVIV
jgi:hypothetical protein